MPLELLLLHFSLLHSCRSIQTIIADRPSIHRRAPTLQHLLQYPASVAVSADSYIDIYRMSPELILLSVHTSLAGNERFNCFSIAVSSVVANKVEALVISAAYMPPQLLKSSTSMQHKLIRPNSNNAHSLCRPPISNSGYLSCFP